MPISLTVPKAVIFDFDGVLVNSEIIALAELHKSLSQIGIAIEKEAMVPRFLGASFEGIARFVEGEIGPIDVEGFRNSWYDSLFQRYRAELSVMTDASQLLDSLDNRSIPYCIASGGSYRRLNFVLELTGLDRRFQDRAFSADSVMRGKPEPDVFLYAARRMNVDNCDCLVVEDALAGVVAARMAGMPVIGYVGGDHLNECREAHIAKLMSAGALTTVDALMDISGFLPKN